MRLTIAIQCFILMLIASIAPLHAQEDGGTVQQEEKISIVSLLDIASEYGIRAAYITDTNTFIATVSNMKGDYSEKGAFCSNIRTRVQTLLVSLRSDYKHQDTLIMIGKNRAVNDYNTYEPMLRQLATVALHYSNLYHSLEKDRKKIRQVNAMALIDEDARAVQQAMNDEAQMLLDSAMHLHQIIREQCLQNPTADKTINKERHDIYYVYLPIYNKISTLPQNSNEATLDDLNQLIWMQNDMINNVVCDNAYNQRIASYHQVLKKLTEDNARDNDIYRSYMRNFTHTSSPLYFRTIEGYRHYTEQMQDIIQVQDHYATALRLRDSINRYTDTILALTIHRYPNMATAYRAKLSTVNTLPTFNNIKESNTFIAEKRNFIVWQQYYIDMIHRIDHLRQRGDKMMRNARKSCSDLQTIYSGLPTIDDIATTLTDIEQFEIFDQTIAQREHLLDNFDTIIALRDSVPQIDKQIKESPFTEKELIRGYKNIRNKITLPQVESAEQVETCISETKKEIYKLLTCKRVLNLSERMHRNDEAITAYSKTLPNIVGAYRILKKETMYRQSINAMTDISDYSIWILDQTEMQGKFLNILQSDQAEDINQKMTGLRDAKRIKSLFM